jgi:hypothetical protein
MQRVAPYQTGNPGWKEAPTVEDKVDNNGNQAPQEVTTTSHTKTNSNSSLPHTMDMAMRNVKITPPKGKLL